MEDSELEVIDSTLRSSLADSGLEWVTAQVDAVIEEERRVLVEEQPAAHYLAPPSAHEFGARARPAVYTTRPYTLQERVLLLIQATRRAIVHAAEAEVAIADFLSNPFSDDGELELIFVREDDDGPQRIFNPELARSSHSLALDFAQSLDELARRIES